MTRPFKKPKVFLVLSIKREGVSKDDAFTFRKIIYEIGILVNKKTLPTKRLLEN